MALSPSDLGTRAQQLPTTSQLLTRIVSAAKQGKKVTFLFGSGLTAKNQEFDDRGVPSASAMVTKVIEMFKGTDQELPLASRLANVDSVDQYQEAMRFLIQCHGQDALNSLVRDSVLEAREVSCFGNQNLTALDADVNGWWLPPGIIALSQLAVHYRKVFDGPLFTSNFDPLIEVGIRKAGGQAAAIVLDTDGSFQHTILHNTTQVVHFHGYWIHSDTLHTVLQLQQDRPQLKGALRELLRDRLLVVIAYGGWRDVFTSTLVELASENAEHMDVAWTFYADGDEYITKTHGKLIEALHSRGGERIVFYKGINCHVLLPDLVSRLGAEPSSNPTATFAIEDAKSPDLSREITDLCDYPPQPAVWVGREDELRRVGIQHIRVVAITGIGGQGKSTLAAKYLESAQQQNSELFWDWRDCREQSNTLHTQLTRIIERMTHGEVSVAQLSGTETTDVIKLLFKFLARKPAIIVLDNIDHYVDVTARRADGFMNILIEHALKVGHAARFIITCRPRMEYFDPNFVELALPGLTIHETRSLFEARGVLLTEQQGERVHVRTRGHPLWLTLIATQISKNRANFDELITRIGDVPEAGLPKTMLMEIWKTLNAKQQTVLHYMAELLRPETEEKLGEYLSDSLNFNQLTKATRALKTLDLVVVKSPQRGPTTLELHPLIREFVRYQFPQNERSRYIVTLIRFLDKAIQEFRQALNPNAPYSVLENWTSKVELSINCGRFADALGTLKEVGTTLLERGYSEEFARLATNIFLNLNWTNEEISKNRDYDDVITELAQVLTLLGRTEEADDYMDRFERTVTGKTARYVCLCNMRCYSYWYRRDYDRAKKWGNQGVNLKTAGNLDTKYDCQHNLALARRDSGDVDQALTFFLHGEDLAKVINPSITEAARGGHFYGNIGRCLWFQGNTQGSLVCLRKSALLLETEHGMELLQNQGWAAFWIGEMLEQQRKLELAWIAYKRAEIKWREISPPRSDTAVAAAERVAQELGGDSLKYDEAEIEPRFLNWLKT